MKTSITTKAKRGAKRDLVAELSEGMEALADARHGKRTLRTHAVEFKPAPNVTPRELIRVRKSLKISRASPRFIYGLTSELWRIGSRGALNQTYKRRY